VSAGEWAASSKDEDGFISFISEGEGEKEKFFV